MRSSRLYYRHDQHVFSLGFVCVDIVILACACLHKHIFHSACMVSRTHMFSLFAETLCGGRVRCMSSIPSGATEVCNSDTPSMNQQLVTATSNGSIHIWSLTWVPDADDTSDNSHRCEMAIVASKTLLGGPRCVCANMFDMGTYI
jgi:hypothetical protein